MFVKINGFRTERPWFDWTGAIDYSMIAFLIDNTMDAFLGDVCVKLYVTISYSYGVVFQSCISIASVIPF